MAEDSMEISSEHGADVGPDDIDIDIEFVPHIVDDDQMVEDVDDFDITFGHIQSPAIGNDDIMLDSENASLSMGDAEVNLDEELIDVSHEPEEVSEQAIEATTETENNGPSTSFEMYPTSDFTNTASSKEPVDQVHETGEMKSAIVTTNETTSGPPTDNDANTREQLESRVETNVQESALDIPEESNLFDNQSASDNLQSVGDAERSAANESANAEESQGGFIEQDESESKTNAQSRELAVVEFGKSSSMSKVNVIYHDANYALFSASDSDDPDSYFLQDVEVVEQPLTSLMAELRGVVHDEIATDEELCLAFHELGLEFYETSSYSQTITFTEIVELYEALKRNDGIEVIENIDITLSIRVDCSKRLATLLDGAAKEKGLIDLAYWENGAAVAGNDQNANINEDKDFEKESHYPADEARDTPDTAGILESAKPTNTSTQLPGQEAVSDTDHTIHPVTAKAEEHVTPEGLLSNVTSQPSVKTELNDTQDETNEQSTTLAGAGEVDEVGGDDVDEGNFLKYDENYQEESLHAIEERNADYETALYQEHGDASHDTDSKVGDNDDGIDGGHNDGEILEPNFEAELFDHPLSPTKDPMPRDPTDHDHQEHQTTLDDALSDPTTTTLFQDKSAAITMPANAQQEPEGAVINVTGVQQKISSHQKSAEEPTVRKNETLSVLEGAEVDNPNDAAGMSELTTGQVNEQNTTDAESADTSTNTLEADEIDYEDVPATGQVDQADDNTGDQIEFFLEETDEVDGDEINYDEDDQQNVHDYDDVVTQNKESSLMEPVSAKRSREDSSEIEEVEDLESQAKRVRS